MSWIQENKFVAGLATATVVVGGAILLIGNSQGGAYDEELAKYNDLRDEHVKLEKAKPYPNAGNLEKREKEINLYETAIGDIKTSLVKYQKGELASLSPEQFSDARVKMEKELRAAFESSGTTLPETCNFGFEKYKDVQAKAGATARLNFQLGAMQWLLNELAEAKPRAILNINRTELPVESGQAAGGSEAPQRGGRARRGAQSKQLGASNNAYQLMPIELSFTASEASVRNFLKQMVNSKEYFFSMRALRIRNEKQIAPTVNDANFPASGGDGGSGGSGADPFGGLPFAAEGAEAEGATEDEDKSAARSERILKQVLGDEKLHVYMSFDILLMKAAPSETKPRSKAKSK